MNYPPSHSWDLRIHQFIGLHPLSYYSHALYPIHFTPSAAMSTPASPSTPLTPLQRPLSPELTRPSMSRTTSLNITPKSEYLRNALQARRAHITSPMSPSESRSQPPPTLRLPEISTPETAPDIFAEYALSEEQTTPVSPIRRRRPSDAGLPRSKTNRELTVEIERLKDSLMTSNMRVELLKKNNSQLQHDLTKAKEQIEELEPLEQENHDLREENDSLRLKVDNMDEEIEHLKDNNDAMRKNNEELAALAEESASHWQDQEYAIDEAAECIVKLEEEKGGLAAELLRLKERVAALEDMSRSITLVDGSPGRYPTRMYSIDESRPSTSHFDSDYYSQPASPSIKASGDSFISITPSERSKKFLDLSVERRQSARELGKRISAASLQALSIRPSCPVPEVPQIPAAYQQQAVRLIEEGSPEVAPIEPGRYRTGQQLISESLLDIARLSPTCSDSAPSRSPTPHSEGLRSLYNPDRPIGRRALSDSCPVSHRTVSSSSNPVTPKTSQSSVLETTSPFTPSRSANKPALTRSSAEHIQHRSPRHERHSSSGTAFNVNIRSRKEIPSPQRASMVHPPHVSVVSEQATESDPREDKDRWWRNMDRLTLPQVLAQSQSAPAQPATQSPSVQQTMQPLSPQQTARTLPPVPPEKASSPWQDDSYVTVRPSRSWDKTKKTTSPIAERDFFFNVAEDEDTFIRKATAWIGGSRR